MDEEEREDDEEVQERADGEEDAVTDEELREIVQVLSVVGCVWWVGVATIGLYWATGGAVGVSTLWGGRGELLGGREPWIEDLLWSFVAVSVVFATLTLTTPRWSRSVAMRAMGAVAWVVGLSLVPFVVVDTLLSGLALVDLVGQEGIDRTERAWRLFFWNPWWVVGVVCFCVTAWVHSYAERRSRVEGDGSEEADTSS